MAEHADLVAWVMGRLDADSALEFEAHMLACDECRREAAELRDVTRLLDRGAPAFEVPGGLEDRVFAALPAAPRQRKRVRWGWAPAWAAALAVLAFALIVALHDPAAPQLALRSTTGQAVDVTATVRVTPVGREVELDIGRLRDPRPGGLYELWFVAPDDTRRRPHRVSAGTFHPDESGRGRVRLLAAADPKRYPRLSVTLQPSNGDPRRIGPEVLRP
jgi:anti-sigma-K factor RskA